MNVQHVILGMLVRQPLSGYEMKRRFENLFSYFFDASYGTIYPALNRMEKEGLITKENIVQEGRPNKHLYSVTPKGKEQFEAYLHSPVEEDVMRSDFLMRLFFGEYVERHEAIRWIRSEIEKTEAMCGRLENDYARYRTMGMSPTQELCIQIGIASYRSKLDTLRSGLAEMSGQPAARGPRPVLTQD